MAPLSSAHFEWKTKFVFNLCTASLAVKKLVVDEGLVTAVGDISGTSGSDG